LNTTFVRPLGPHKKVINRINLKIAAKLEVHLLSWARAEFKGYFGAYSTLLMKTLVI